MEERKQNACLMTTSLNEETGKHELTYIPLCVDNKTVEFFLTNGTCDNNQAIIFELTEGYDTFWTGMWDSLGQYIE